MTNVQDVEAPGPQKLPYLDAHHRFPPFTPISYVSASTIVEHLRYLPPQDAKGLVLDIDETLSWTRNLHLLGCEHWATTALIDGKAS